jgi:hypothetical protein
VVCIIPSANGDHADLYSGNAVVLYAGGSQFHYLLRHRDEEVSLWNADVLKLPDAVVSPRGFYCIQQKLKYNCLGNY